MNLTNFEKGVVGAVAAALAMFIYGSHASPYNTCVRAVEAEYRNSGTKPVQAEAYANLDCARWIKAN